MDHSTYHLFVGVDIAAATFDASWQTTAAPTPARTFPQTPAGFAQFQQALQASGIAPAATLVVMEATSSYWVTLAVELHAAGYHVSVVNPTQVHHYAKSLPRRSKTDALDAQVLTHFAAARRPALWTPPPAVYHELRQRLVARDGLLSMRQQARNQLHALQQWPVSVAGAQQALAQVIATVDEQLHALEQEIAQVLAEGAWAAAATQLQSIPGIGLLTAAWILVTTVKFTLCPTPEAAAHYAGLAPLERQSGTSVRGRPSIGHSGNGRLRTALYLATLSATQHNPVITTFYKRLRAAGKPMKVARCAAARKLLHLAFAVVTKEQLFDPSFKKLPSPVPIELAIAA
jgi:transposase